jgi:hypothetical protein
LGHSRLGPAGRRSSHVRYAPKATVGHQNAIGRDVPKADIAPPHSTTSSLEVIRGARQHCFVCFVYELFEPFGRLWRAASN